MGDKGNSSVMNVLVCWMVGLWVDGGGKGIRWMVVVRVLGGWWE